MDNPFAAVRVNRKSGSEKFVRGNRETGHDLLGFWQWSASDLSNNTLRGMLAEYIVACDLGVENGTRTEWDAFDLVTEHGVKVEVKSAAYLQSWQQNKLSNIEFSICPTTAWFAETNTYCTERKRHADVYVFCLLNHRDKTTLNPLDLDQWEFYIMPTRILDTIVPTQAKIGLNSLLRLNPLKARFGEINNALLNLSEYLGRE